VGFLFIVLWLFWYCSKGVQNIEPLQYQYLFLGCGININAVGAQYFVPTDKERS